MVSFVSGLQFTRVSTFLRVFVELIGATITDVMAFSVILMYILVAATCTFHFGHVLETGGETDHNIFSEFRL